MDNLTQYDNLHNLNDIMIHTMFTSLQNAELVHNTGTKLNHNDTQTYKYQPCTESSQYCYLGKFPSPILKRTCGFFESCQGPEPCGSTRCCFLGFNR